MLADPFRQHLTLFRRQQLGIAQASHAILRIEDDGRSDHGTKQRTASDFIHSCDKARPQLRCLLLKPEGAMQLLQQTQLGGGSRERFPGRGRELFRHEVTVRASSPSRCLWGNVENRFVWGGRPRPPLWTLQLLLVLLRADWFRQLRSRSKAAGEGARPTLPAPATAMDSSARR